MPHELEIMLKSYDYLRAEVLNSISWQNRVLTAAAIIISLLLGLGLTIAETLKLSVIIIPPAVIALTAFWLVEQSRMMRAGDHMQLLEDDINIRAGGAYILWENWLRRGGISWRDVHTIHHISQYLGVFGVFYVVSGISIWKTITLGLLPCWAWVLYIAMLVFLLVLIILVVRHRPGRRDKFEEWKNEYSAERLGTDVAPDELKDLKSTKD